MLDAMLILFHSVRTRHLSACPQNDVGNHSDLHRIYWNNVSHKASKVTSRHMQQLPSSSPALVASCLSKPSSRGPKLWTPTLPQSNMEPETEAFKEDLGSHELRSSGFHELLIRWSRIQTTQPVFVESIWLLRRSML